MDLRERTIEELKAEIDKGFKKGSKVSKADIGRVLDVCLRKQGFEELFETRIYKNYGTIYCYLLELINQREKQGMLLPIQEEMLRGGSREVMYGVTIPVSQRRVDIYVYKTKEEAMAQNLRRTSVLRGIRMGDVSEKKYRQTLATMENRAYRVEKSMETMNIRNGELKYLVEGKYKVEIIEI